MPNEGPTTVGSIVGKLSMDRDQWIADKELTKEDARELAALHPTIPVDMDTAAAMAKIEALRIAADRAGAIPTSSAGMSGPSASTAVRVDAVAAAERRLAAAVSAADSAYAKAELAQMRLNEIREKGVRAGSRLAAAELAATEALKRLERANEQVTVSEAALSAAQEKAARAAMEKAIAENAAARSTVKANEANKTHVSRLGLITTAIGILIPMIAPLGAYVVGLAGAFTVMGVAGVLAILGIRNAMQQGTQTGDAYRRGLRSLKGDLDSLSGTAANSMLASFNTSVATIHAALPGLNMEVAQFSSLLGVIGNNLLSGVITGFHVLSPLLMTAGQYVNRLSAGFNAWTSNGGLRRFVDYALGALPLVEQTIGNVVKMVMDLVIALAPLGAVILGVIDGFAQMVSWLAQGGQLFAALTGAGLAALVMFKGWGIVAPMLAVIIERVALLTGSVTLLGVSMKVATGPIGWIIAGIGALITVLAVSSVKTSQAASAVADYTAAVQADTGAIGENVRAQAAKKLADDGSFDSAKKLGISYDELLNATLQLPGAQQIVTDKLNQASAAYDKGFTAVMGNRRAMEEYAAEHKDTRDAILKTRDAVDVNSSAIQTNRDNYMQQTEALSNANAAQVVMAQAAGVSTAAYLAASAAQTDTRFKLQQTTAAMFLQNDAAGLLKQSLDLLNGKTISAAQAQNQFDSQLANMGAHISKTGKHIDRATASLEGNSAAAVANRGELINLVQAAETNAQAFRDNGGSAEDTRQKLIAMKKEIVDHAVKVGEDRDQVQRFIDTIFQIPAKIPPTQIEVSNENALASIKKVQDALSRLGYWYTSIPGMSANVNTHGIRGAFADGGTVRGPGGPKSDSVLIRASAGEEITPEPQASMYRSTLKQIAAGTYRPAGSVATARPSVQYNSSADKVIKNYWSVTASPGMSAQTVGLVAADRLNFLLRGA